MRRELNNYYYSTKNKVVKYIIIRAFQFKDLVCIQKLENFLQESKDSSVLFYGRYHNNIIRTHFTMFSCNTNDLNRGIFPQRGKS